jgi:hypothetical protein
MDYAFYRKADGFIVSVLQTSTPPATPPSEYGHVPIPYNTDTSGYYVVDGVLTPKPSEVLAQETAARAWIMMRRSRDALLAASDWTQVPDAPVDQVAWATYRQALRDITAQAGFPEQINWPEAP